MHWIGRLELDDIGLRFDTSLVAVVLWASEACIVLPDLLLDLLLNGVELTFVAGSLILRIRLVVRLGLNA